MSDLLLDLLSDRIPIQMSNWIRVELDRCNDEWMNIVGSDVGPNRQMDR